uniref:Lipocalin n=1 Tax=Rhipicephalus zambeziensis TaxID=60191 RepID=A0A224YEF5_9ACAR
MSGQIICLKILLLLMFIVARKWTNGESEVPQKDIRKFLNTSELIWTYNSTASSLTKCRVDKKESITGEQIVFQRSFHRLKKGDWAHVYLQGIFSFWHWKNNKTYDTIIVSRAGENMSRWKTEELLVHQDNDNRCAVFKTFTRGKSIDIFFVDIRIKNSSVHEELSEDCLKAYNRARRRRRSYGRYSPDCQKEVHDNKEHFV